MSQSPSPSGGDSQSHRGLRGYACVPCAKRKVRCDRQEPCANCRRRPSDHCHYLAPHPRRRHPKPSETSAAMARLQHLEQIVRELGVDTQRKPSTNAPLLHSPALGSVKVPPHPEHGPGRSPNYPPHPADPQPGYLVGTRNQGQSRYLDDPIWNRLNEEVKNETDVLREASDDDDNVEASRPAGSTNAPEWRPPGPGSMLLLQQNKSVPTVHHLHPAPHQIVALWRKFLDNVHPLVRIVTPRQKEDVIMRTLTAMDSIRLRSSLFLFSVYFITVLSMTDSDCRQLLGESRAVLLDKYQYATEHSLTAANILRTSDFVAMQSFTLYLLAMRQRTDMNTLWALAGLIIRLGQRLGLHRDGALLNLGPWEAELRRRLWWHMQHIDTRAAQLSGSNGSVLGDEWDTKLPSNINDDDLYPSMTEQPQDRVGATDMMHVLCRFELVDFVRSFRRPNGQRYGFSWVYSDIPLAEKDQAIDALEEHMQQKYLKFCDALKPTHFMTTITIRAALNSIRLSAHHPRLQGGQLTDLPQSEQDYLFELSMRSLQYDSMAHQQKLIEGFRWHSEAYFQWAALILLLIQLRTRTSGAAVDRAWDLLKDVYEVHPNFVTDGNKSLHAATQTLAVKAWAAREQYWKMQPQFFASVQPPSFVQAIRSQRQAAKDKRHAHSNSCGSGWPGKSAPDAQVSGSVQVGSLNDSFHSTGALNPATGYQQQQQLPQSGASNGSVLEEGSSGDSLSFSPMDWAQWESLITEDMQGGGWGTDTMDFGSAGLNYNW